MAKAYARLLTPSGIRTVSTGRVTHTTGQGVTASVVLKDAISLEALREGSMQLLIDDQYDSYESPPLRATHRSRKKSEQARQWEVQLVDEPAWKLSTPGKSLPTFTASTSTAILNALATAQGVTVVGMPSWPVLVEDFKQSQFSDGLRRLCAAMALEWRVTPSGQLVVASVMATTGNLTFHCNSVEERINATKRYTGLRVEKSSPIQSQVCFVVDPEQGQGDASYHEFEFPNGLLNVLYSEHGVSGGSLTQVIAWNGPPGQGGSKIVRYWSSIDVLGPVVDTTLPATHAQVVFTPSADAISLGIPQTYGICFQGTPPTALSGVDLSFSEFIGTQERPFPQTYSEPLIPTRAAAIANGPGYLRQRNKDAYRVVASGRLQLATELAATMEVAEEDGWPLSRVETFTHNLGEGGFSTSVEGCIFEGEEEDP